MSEEKLFEKTVYMAPKAQIITLDNFDLSKIEVTFKPASFERKLSTAKYRKIANGIMDNKFVDNVLRVSNSKGNVTYDIIDGQHRVEGLRYARENFGLQAYDLILFCYEGTNLREIYRRLNLGKPLTLGDHLKALDTGRLPFFSELREFCSHYNEAGKIKYAVMLNCLHYAKSTSTRAIRPIVIDDFLTSITSDDLNKCKEFIPLLYQISTNRDSDVYRYTLMRNYFRVLYENKISEVKAVELGEKLLRSSKIKELAEKRDTFAMVGIYHYIIDIAGPEVGLHLEKGDVGD